MRSAEHSSTRIPNSGRARPLTILKLLSTPAKPNFFFFSYTRIAQVGFFWKSVWVCFPGMRGSPHSPCQWVPNGGPWSTAGGPNVSNGETNKISSSPKASCQGMITPNHSRFMRYLPCVLIALVALVADLIPAARQAGGERESRWRTATTFWCYWCVQGTQHPTFDL